MPQLHHVHCLTQLLFPTIKALDATNMSVSSVHPTNAQPRIISSEANNSSSTFFNKHPPQPTQKRNVHRNAHSLSLLRPPRAQHGRRNLLLRSRHQSRFCEVSPWRRAGCPDYAPRQGILRLVLHYCDYGGDGKGLGHAGLCEEFGREFE
jgi:hypothetical protein